ncbi:MAG: DEAD/DEAH box helicase [Armatimonadota bacterium]|nr:DEAD/DEAH box helicase [Armatimonadota bacterium]MDW8155499.1 DEAD/DEAH box helicase [Armatimonadota bacterium]
MTLPSFHPAILDWFVSTFGRPTPVQEQGWQVVASGQHALLVAPTGSGKTLAAFLWALSELVSTDPLPDETRVLYVSPLRALSADVQRNLEEPLRQIRQPARALGHQLPEVRVAVRTGDTLARDRERMKRRPPHVLITTPESLYLLLTAPGSRGLLRTVQTVIVDELHALAQDKRGAHLSLSLERLERVTARPPQRIGLSATAHPVEGLVGLLVGTGRTGPDGRPRCAVVDVGWQREWDLAVWVPRQVLGPVATHEVWAEVYDRIAELASCHRTTLVFVATRRLAERLAHRLTLRLGEGRVASHHGSLARSLREKAERRLKDGDLRVVVATASLELGIDIGSVDLVCHVGAPRSIATLLQRVGRSGHGVDRTPRGVLFPLTRDELVQCAAAVRAVRAGQLDRVRIPRKPLDVLAQQLAAEAAAEPCHVEDLWRLARGAYPYRELRREEFEQVLAMLADGVAPSRGRAGALVHWDRTTGIVRGRRGTRTLALTSGGAIPETFEYDVVAEPDEKPVGRVNEDFAVESQAGDVFLLGNTSWRVRRVESSGRVRVEAAGGAPPTIPFWLGEAPARTPELSQAVSDLREEVARRAADPESAAQWLVEEAGLDWAGAQQVVDYVRETLAVLGCVPTQRRVVAERFFDEAGGMQLVLHAPFGARITRAWGLALRKRFCLTFDFELQAAATDDGVVLSLGQQHSFPLEAIFGFVRPHTARKDLLQATLQSPLFATRWRQAANRALAVPRRWGGRRVPPQIQRMRAEDLLAAIFPEQVGCQDNHTGPIDPPDHPLVNQTLLDCLEDAMDLEGLVAVVEAVERGDIQTVAVDTPQPSPASHEILSANPYAFLDDAPLEERRARAVRLRRVDPELASGPGALDPEAIEEVRAQAQPDVRDPDELHDLLQTVVFLPDPAAEPWEESARELVRMGRAVRVQAPGLSGYAARERAAAVHLLWPAARVWPDVPIQPEQERERALRDLVAGWMLYTGPVTASQLGARLGLAPEDVRVGLAALEGLGVVLRGRFTPSEAEEEWCERRLLSRIHRLTVEKLRREMEPTSPADFVRFLLRWQHVHPGTQLHGRAGLLEILRQLQGFELPAGAWEQWVLPARLARYDPRELDSLCLAGLVAWGRIQPGSVEEAREATRPPRLARNTPIAFVLREELSAYLLPVPPPARLSPLAREVDAWLRSRGACFLSDVARALGRLAAEVEEALWELVAAGRATGDGMDGLRSLLWRGQRRPRRGRLRVLTGRLPPPAGRWAPWGEAPAIPDSERLERLAEQMLRRYGVVFREVLTRERAAPPWRELVRIFRRWEAQGRIRGGRFVSGFAGEQFALPEAVEALRAVRRTVARDETVVLSAADPLNLVGVLVPGDRLPPSTGVGIVFKDGAAVEVGPLGALLRRVGASAPAGAL